MKLLFPIIVAAFLGSLSADEEEDEKRERHIKFENEALTKWTWLPLDLDEFEQKLLSQRATPPQKALDYYLMLPPRYFENVENSTERRVTFIDHETLSDQFLHADFTIPRTDGGAFDLTIRIFQKGGEPLIALLHRKGTKLIERNTQASRRKSWKPGGLRRPIGV